MLTLWEEYRSVKPRGVVSVNPIGGVQVSKSRGVARVNPMRGVQEYGYVFSAEDIDVWFVFFLPMGGQNVRTLCEPEVFKRSLLCNSILTTGINSH